MSTTFGEYLRFIRRNSQTNNTVTALGALLNISHSRVSNVEMGKQKPFDEKMIEKIAEIYSMSESEKNKLLDLAAHEKGTVSKDIQEIIANDETLRRVIRIAKSRNEEVQWDKVFIK